ncbi:DUF3800 domain-containing protein [Stenotrophomonas pavanii]|uniref:DUF3800 domain-containing protein n=1 Tax=Stenotrophomonas pavanii TaxID=487698 RepID=UPI0028960EF2|nr:DUF3800 domain-containing protein [Stenotrophomonas pavanii]MDT3527471.1 DUF3800 domain-containing protein [Stenotrophomonas pavanii]
MIMCAEMLFSALLRSGKISFALENISMELYFDESGYTGANLLDSAQPIFALACTDIATSTAECLLSNVLSQNQLEAKYTKLRKSHRGRQSVLEILRSDVVSPAHFWTCAADKRFSLSAQLVDKLIEPAMYERGLDAYERDFVQSLARLIHFAGEHAFPNGVWGRLLEAWGQAMRERNDAAYAAYDILVDEAESCYREEFRIGPWIFSTRGTLADRLASYTSATTFDPATDSFVSLVANYMSIKDGWFSVIHDTSKPLQETMGLLRQLMDPDASPVQIGHSGRRMELPLRVKKIAFANSASQPQLQLADIVAGATADFLSAMIGYKTRESYHDELENSGLAELLVGVVAAEATEATTPVARPDEQRGISLADGMAGFLLQQDARTIR